MSRKPVLDKSSKSKPKQRPKARAIFLTIVASTFAAVGAWFYMDHFRDRAKATREISLSTNHPTYAANSEQELLDDVEYRRQLREQDKKLLDALRAKKARFNKPIPTESERQEHVLDYLDELEETRKLIEPNQAGLLEDIDQRLEDEDFIEAASAF